MKTLETNDARIVSCAARRVRRKFRRVPGFYHELEDLVQIGSMAAWTARALGVATNGLLYHIVKCDILDEVRSFVRLKEIPDFISFEDWLARGNDIVSLERSPLDSALFSELMQFITDKRLLLTDLEGTTAILYYGSGLSQSEIAQSYGVRREAIKARLSAAMNKIRTFVFSGRGLAA